MTTRAAQGIRAFVAHARDQAGGREELVRAIEPELGRHYGATAVSSWTADDPATPPGDVLFAIARALDISLDRFALEDSLLDRVREVEKLLFALAHYTGYDAAEWEARTAAQGE